MIATLLIVTVLSSGGPHKAKPSPLSGVTVNVTRLGRVATLRTDRHGRAYLRVLHGRYRIQAECARPTASYAVKLRLVLVRGNVTRVRVYCSIP